ncbi:MAG TPA: sensor domain-containing diguanylate cyclase [Solirubrobacterales bacterium]|nr:sensor domain-containing diguanylate cyclase [Solirubrobacterales bacterium]
MLMIAGAGLVAMSLILPHPSGGQELALILTATGMALTGIATWFLSSVLPPAASHVLLAATVLVTGVLIWESGLAVGQYGTIFTWATLISAYFYSRRSAAIHLGWLLLVYAGALAVVEGTGGYSPVTRWLFSAVALTVVMLFVNNLASRRERADARARYFFDLSQDMLCTMDTHGRCIEVNGAWQSNLGYRPTEMRGRRLLDLTHPDDHVPATEEAMRVFRGEVSKSLDTRVRAKDGTWHWLRTSSVFEPHEGLVYARSTDVTERKADQEERERLMREVELLARSDALTGLPNRRALDDQLPREMARALREGSPICLAIIDIDHFKTYNDTHGHLAGDTVLRDCAAAWDGELRGEDMILRFGGEEFLVVLPGCGPADATEIVERLRAATPDGQTCSAGLAAWQPGESVDELVGRADKALYEAKESGRDRLVASA